jgi:phenolic acid decarboxylase
MDIMKQIKLGAGSRIVYEWTEGAFAGNVFQVDLLADGRLTWRVLEGHEPGSGATEDRVSVREIAPGIAQVSWLESVGYTITVTIVFAEDRAFGIVSNDKELYPHAGKLREARAA